MHYKHEDVHTLWKVQVASLQYALKLIIIIQTDLVGNQSSVWVITWLIAVMCHLAKCLSEIMVIWYLFKCHHPLGQVRGLVTHSSNVPDWSLHLSANPINSLWGVYTSWSSPVWINQNGKMYCPLVIPTHPLQKLMASLASSTFIPFSLKERNKSAASNAFSCVLCSRILASSPAASWGHVGHSFRPGGYQLCTVVANKVIWREYKGCIRGGFIRVC